MTWSMSSKWQRKECEGTLKGMNGCWSPRQGLKEGWTKNGSEIRGSYMEMLLFRQRGRISEVPEGLDKREAD